MEADDRIRGCDGDQIGLPEQERERSERVEEAARMNEASGNVRTDSRGSGGKGRLRTAKDGQR